MTPLFIGPFLLKSHILVLWLLIIIGILSTLLCYKIISIDQGNNHSTVQLKAIGLHCGYNIPYFSSPEHHDLHHKSHKNKNFGGSNIPDYYLDTLYPIEKANIKT